MKEQELIEYCWKASQQIIISTPNEAGEKADIEGWGSGFFLCYKDRKFFVTCDHNIHLADDNGEAERTGLDFGIELICNYEIPNEPLKTAFIKIPNFYYFDYHTKEYTEFIDLSFSEITSKFPYPIFTAELCDVNQNTIVSKGIKKISINESSITAATTEMKYIVTGCIRNKLKGIRFNRCNVIYKDLTYTGKKYCKDLLVFGTPMKIEYDYWKGLSGSPVFNQDGEIVGMLNRVVDKSNKIYVLPIDTIIKFIDITIMNEENKK